MTKGIRVDERIDIESKPFGDGGVLKQKKLDIICGRKQNDLDIRLGKLIKLHRYIYIDSRCSIHPIRELEHVMAAVG